MLYIWLSKIKGIGPVITRNLIEFSKTITGLFKSVNGVPTDKIIVESPFS